LERILMFGTVESFVLLGLLGLVFIALAGRRRGL
jgi:hypothetical protein